MNERFSPPMLPLQREQEMKFGTQLLPNGTRFRLWAPRSSSVSLVVHDLDLRVPMTALPRGWFEAEVDGAFAGMRYRFVLEDGTEVPDPASRHLPDDVHGPSEIIDPRAFPWTDAGWRGRPWEETVLYEMHVGTFTAEGTFRAAIEKLDYLAELGVTAIQMMPIADFAGRWNWGYDGVSLFAPDASYGRPDDLKALIDAAHARNLSVFLDVVYNHFGPEGNYLPAYTPVVTDKHTTPWGDAVNFDDEGSSVIRDLVFANARYWLNEYRFDGLRFDAVHAIKDSGPRHMLQDLAEQIRASTDGRHIHLVLENSDNHSSWLRRREDGVPALYNAQWNDDVHHVLHVAATGESFWYYADYAGRMDLLGRALAEGFAFQGEYFKHDDRTKGEPSTFLPPTAFVSFIQNHDQIGNRPFGERLGHLVEDRVLRAMTAIYLLSPQIPMIFMGEEWNARQAFPFFSDVGEHLAEAIRESRIAELNSIPHTEDAGMPPDPMSEETFNAAKLAWEDQEKPGCSAMLSLFRDLLRIRHQEIVPRLAGLGGNSGRYKLLGDKVVQVTWTLGDSSELSLTANLSPEPFEGVSLWGSDHLWLEGGATNDQIEGWSVVFTLKRSN
jgi:malto-oligosyltrehalose trehalohydrolase